MDISQIWIAIFGVSAVFMVNHSSPGVRKWGPVMGLVGQPAWIYATYASEQWGIFAMAFIYTASWAMGVYNHWIRPRKEEAAHG